MKTRTVITVLALGLLARAGSLRGSDLIDAAKRGDAAKVNALLAADPGRVDETDGGIGATALHWALIYGKKEAVKAILDHHPDVNRTEAHNGTPMHWAAHFDDGESILWLLDRGARIDHANQFGRTPLLVAARRGCVSVAKALLERGANINARTPDGSTALHIAARNGHAGIIDLLIARGIDPGAKDNQGRTYRDLLFIRPATVPIDPSLCARYAGVYAPPQGPQLEIRLEGGRLFFYAFGKDELLSTSGNRFITSAEVKYFEFVRDAGGNVVEVVYREGDDEIRLKKVQPE